MAIQHNARVAEEAYFLWLQDGMAHGKAEHHWATAEKLLTSRTMPVSSNDDAKSKPAARPAKSRARTKSQRA